MPRGDSAQTVKATFGVRQLLFEGAYLPGERLAELALAERLGVSRTPLRIALTMLEGEGLVEALPGGGFAARALTLAEIHDAIELRGALEGTAARFAAERLESVEELSEMQAVVERLDVTIRESAGSIVAYVELNEAFHDHLVGLAKSDPVTRAVARLRALPFASPGALVPALTHLPAWRESLVVAQHQHRSLLEAIATRQGAWAEEVAREHARLSRHNLDLLLAGREGLETLPGAPLVEVVLRAEA